MPLQTRNIRDVISRGGGTIRSSAAPLAFQYLAAEPRFVILSLGRAGTELLVSLLNAHPRIVCDSEILAFRQAAPAQLVLRRAAMARWRGQAYGFKLLAHHNRVQDTTDPELFLRKFHERGFKIILLERRDRLGQAISSIRGADARRHHHRKDEGARFKAAHLDPVAVLAALYLFEGQATFLRSATADLPALRLVYEDDLEQPDQQQRTIQKVCAYLGLPPAAVSTDLVRITPRPLEQQVENYDEVATLIASTRFRDTLPADPPVA
jgi:hypothetical protein